jgi:hypothetical protein
MFGIVSRRRQQRTRSLAIVLLLIASLATTGAAHAYFSDSLFINVGAETGQFAYEVQNDGCFCITCEAGEGHCHGCGHGGPNGHAYQYGLDGPNGGHAFGGTLQKACGFHNVAQLQCCHLWLLRHHMYGQCGCGSGSGCCHDCCTSEQVDADDDGRTESVHVTLTEADPGAFGLAWVVMRNEGTVPISLDEVELVPDESDNGVEVCVWPVWDPAGRQLETEDDPDTWYDERAALYVAGIHVYEPGTYEFDFVPHLTLWCDDG